LEGIDRDYADWQEGSIENSGLKQIDFIEINLRNRWLGKYVLDLVREFYHGVHDWIEKRYAFNNSG
jgi:hypothetical protein